MLQDWERTFERLNKQPKVAAVICYCFHEKMGLSKPQFSYRSWVSKAVRWTVLTTEEKDTEQATSRTCDHLRHCELCSESYADIYTCIKFKRFDTSPLQCAHAAGGNLQVEGGMPETGGCNLSPTGDGGGVSGCLYGAGDGGVEVGYSQHTCFIIVLCTHKGASYARSYISALRHLPNNQHHTRTLS
jgi:hypothetical protein